VYAAKGGALCLVQGSFSAAPCRTLLIRFATNKSMYASLCQAAQRTAHCLHCGLARHSAAWLAPPPPSAPPRTTHPPTHPDTHRSHPRRCVHAQVRPAESEGGAVHLLVDNWVPLGVSLPLLSPLACLRLRLFGAFAAR
jgi:hypothetical protein